MELELNTDEQKKYPTEPDADGFFFESEDMETVGIAKRVNAETEEEELKVSLSRGRSAIMRELTRKESQKAATIAGANAKGANPKSPELQDRVMCASIALAAKFYDKDGNALSYVMEDIMEFKAKDSNRLNTGCSLLNF